MPRATKHASGLRLRTCGGRLARRLRALGIAGAGVAAAVLGCSEPPPPPAPDPPEVRVVRVEQQAVTNLVEVPGRLQAVRAAEVRARVDGIVQRRLYQEGTDVVEGQPLFAIDPRELRAQLGAVEAELARAEANAANAAKDVERYEGLVAQRAISQQEYDSAVARLRTAEADVAQARARVEAARLDLGYATVTAPLTGRAGRAQVTEGALVSAAAATLLTRIEQIDPIYANFSLSSSEVLEIRREIEAGELTVPEVDRVAVRLVLEDGSVYAHAGRLDFADLRIDEATGSAALRAELPNPDRALLPGQFVRVRIEAGVRPGAILVPQRAVLIEPQGASVLVVGEDGLAAARQVELGELLGDSWLVLDGLESGERVIVEGLQQVRPGTPVRIAPDAREAPDVPTTEPTPEPQPDAATETPERRAPGVR